MGAGVTEGPQTPNQLAHRGLWVYEGPAHYHWSLAYIEVFDAKGSTNVFRFNTTPHAFALIPR